MGMLLINLLLAIAWTFLTGDFAPPNFMVGLVLGFVMLWLGQRSRGGNRYFAQVKRAFIFCAYFVKEVLRANLRMAKHVFLPLDKLQPGIVAVPLDLQRPSEISILANFITLTPGTLSIDVSTDQSTIYVHAININDVEAFRREIKENLESRISEVFL